MSRFSQPFAFFERSSCGLFAVILFVCASLLAGSAAAQTNVGGIISSDTTWQLANSPYMVTSNVLVQSGVTLTIEAGVQVKFTAGMLLQVNGTLVARGTAGLPILMTTSSGSPAPGQWGYVIFADSSVDATVDGSGNYLSGSILEYGTIEYGGSGGAGLRLGSAAPYLNYLTVRQNSSGGISVEGGASVRITNSTISNNSGTGLAASFSGGTLQITNCTITNNTGTGLSVGQGSSSLEVRQSTISNNGGHGVEYPSYYGGLTLENNTVADNTQDGVRVFYSPTITLTGNTVLRNRQGMHIEPQNSSGSSRALVVTGNRIQGNREGGLALIWVYGGG